MATNLVKMEYNVYDYLDNFIGVSHVLIHRLYDAAVLEDPTLKDEEAKIKFLANNPEYTAEMIRVVYTFNI